MTATDKRCGTCRYHELRGPAYHGSQYGYCDWVSRHLVDLRIPYWIKNNTNRPLTHATREDCEAWEARQ